LTSPCYEPVPPPADPADIRKAVETLESVARSWKRVFGEAHPETPMVQDALATARETLARALVLASAAPAAGSAEEKS